MSCWIQAAMQQNTTYLYPTFFSKYRTRAIIARGLYLFYLIFHCGLYCRAVYIAERLVFS